MGFADRLRLCCAAVLAIAVSCGGGSGTSDKDVVQDNLTDAVWDTAAPDGHTELLADNVEPDGDQADFSGAPDGELDAPSGPDEWTHSGALHALEDLSHFVLENGLLVVHVDKETGLFSVSHVDRGTVLTHAESRVVFAAKEGGLPGSGGGEFVATSGAAFDGLAVETRDDALGDGLEATILWALSDHPGCALRQTLGLREGGTYLLARVVLVSGDGCDLGDEFPYTLSPLVADESRGGGLFVGKDPSVHVVIDNGADMYFDFVARVFKVGKGDSLLFPPGNTANWNLGVHDSADGLGLVAGFLEFSQGVGLVSLDYRAAASFEDQGRKAFTRFEGFNYNDPAPTIPPSGEVESGLFYVDFAPTTTQEGLENWAARYALHAGKTVWTDVPTGWNSWGGGGGEGGMGTNIDEAKILANLDAAQEDFLPFGMKWFFLDNGWEISVGTWDTNKDRFPDHDGLDGMAWLAQEIESRGFIPGIWIAPFWVNTGSQVATEHPDWIAQKNDFAGVLLGDSDATLDLTRPEVLEWVHDLFVKLTQEWGYRWVKVDFAYYALFATGLSDSTKSAGSAYHHAMNVIREAIGPETYFMTIAATGLSLDAGDGGRLTLDNSPIWGDSEVQSFKVTVLTAAHRYYLSKLWNNHPDLLFYRDNLGLTLNEARAFTSFVSLSGGVMKLGDTYVELHQHPEWLQMARSIIPVYAGSARPLDLFELSHPEVWHLPVTRGERSFDVVGLFNWGLNLNILTSTDRPEETVSKSVSLQDLGRDPAGRFLVFNAWERECRWVEDGLIEETLEPRHEAVLVIHPESSAPQVVFTTRHLLGTAVDVTQETFDPGEPGGLLRATVDTPVGFEWVVYVSTGDWTLTSVLSPEEAVVEEGPCNGVKAIRFTAAQALTPLEVTFE